MLSNLNLAYLHMHLEDIFGTTFIIISSSVKVSSPCINEINRLISKFQNDSPQIKKSKEKKRKIQVTSIIDD
uniref:Uncharacterized protein n=1 Tax=Amphimedon queenslandica TaxID=400682 RepID=A0A1X7UYI5_AMPQE